MAAHDFRVGPLGGRYELCERLGGGGGGEVFRAREVAVDFPRHVCVKRLGGILHPDDVSAMREEARLLARIRHANVVSLIAMGEDDGAPFLVLELISGLDLRSFALALLAVGRTPTTGYLPDPVAVHVACGVVRALGAVQRALPGLVHRDVTPHNVLVSREGEVKLADFGIALAVGRVRSTSPSFVRGKLGYMAPEQVRGEPLDVRADLFAAGVMLFELLTRRRPFGLRRGVDELRAIAIGDVTPLAALRPGLPRGLAEAVDRMLSARVAARFPTPDDALRALAPFSAGDFGSLRLAELVGAVLERRASARDAENNAESEATTHGFRRVQAQETDRKSPSR